MAILAGIDEAGYGPLLGPLVVTGVAFDVPDEALDTCLWETLQASVTRRIKRRDSRLPIADSKLLHRGADGFKTLEKTALAMSLAANVTLSCGMEWLSAISPDIQSDIESYPWYRGFPDRLPMSNDAVQIKLCANAVRRDLERQGIRIAGIYCQPMPEGHFNRLVTATRNKSIVSLDIVLRLIDRIARQTSKPRLRICVDRQGGRLRYGEALRTAFAGSDLRILQETADSSRYHLTNAGRTLEIEFLVGAEERHLPVALASVISKYVRELFMSTFNRFWTDRVDGLRPTAGYYQDGRRFIREIESEIKRSGVIRSMLVRSR